jgi:hypothetical protein
MPVPSKIYTQDMSVSCNSAQQTLLGLAQQAPGIAGQTAKSLLQLQGFRFQSAECGLPECCQFSERGGERNSKQEGTGRSIKVYPNPAQTSVTFEWPDQSSPAQLSIFDVTGRLIWTQEFQQRAVWEAADTPGGMYFYTVSIEGTLLNTGKISIIK